MSGSIVLRNIASRLGAKFVGNGLAFAASILLIRYLGAERLGQYHYASTFASIFGLLAGLGLPILLTRDAARDKAGAGAMLGAVMSLQALLSLLAFALITVAAAAFNPWELALPIVILGLGVAVNALATPYVAMLNAFEHMHLSSAIDTVSNLVRVGLILGAVQLGVGIVGLVTLLVLNPIVYLALAKNASDRYCVRPVAGLAAARLKGLLVASVPFALMVVFNNLYFRIDVIMLQKMQGDTAVGVYSAAYRLIDVFLLVGANIAGVLYPRMASEARGPEGALRHTVERLFRYMTAIGIPVAVTIAILASEIVPMLFGEAFRDSVLPLEILIWAIALIFMALPLAHCLNATGHEWRWITILGVNTALNVGLNLVLIPAFGVIGAAVSTVACEGVGLGLLLRFSRPVVAVRALPTVIPVSLAAAIMAAPLWYFGPAHAWAGLAAAAPLYAAALYVCGFWTAEETLVMRRLFAPSALR